MALCSIWMSQFNHKRYDLSTYYGSQCLTMMVPRPKYINEASIIYLSLKSKLWFYFGSAFAAIICMLIAISKIGISTKLYKRRDVPFHNFTKTVTEVVNIATSHGLTKFPAQTPIKFVILAWFIFSLLFGVIYSCGYVSLLTTPPLSQPIDTVDEFLENGLLWGEFDGNSKPIRTIRKYNSTLYTNLVNSIVKEHSWQEREDHIKGGEYGYMVTKISDKYLANLPWENITAKYPLRVMRSCISSYFTGLAFQLRSPYRDFFSYKLQL